MCLVLCGSVYLPATPNRAEHQVEGIREMGRDPADGVVQLAHAGGGFIAQAEVDGEIRTKLVIILYEELRALDAHVRHGLVGRLPAIHITQQEVGEGSTTWNAGGDRWWGHLWAVLLCIRPVKVKLTV